MTIPLRQSTAGQEIPLGYFLDSTDGNTEETGLTIANTDIKLWKNGATTLANKNSGGATHISNGIYYAVLDATDTNTLGGMSVFAHLSGALPVKVDCVVYPATIYDSVIAGTDLLQSDLTQIAGAAVSTSTAQLGVNVVNAGGSAVSQSGGLLNANVTQVSGDATAADNAEAFFDGTGYAGTNNIIPTVTAVGSVTGNVGGNVAGSVGSVTGGINTSGGTITTLDALDTAQDTQHGTTQSAIAGLNDVSTADVNTQVDTALADYDAPTYNELLNLIRILARKDSAIASDLTSLLTSLNADLGSGAGAYSNTTDSIEAIRDRGDSAWVTAAGTSTLTQADIRTAVGLASANLDTQLDALPTAAEIRAEIDTNSTELAQIITDIAVVDSNVDAILVDTGTDIPARFDGVEGATFNTATDSLEAIRDRGDAAWTTGTTPATAAAIADAVWDEARAGHTTNGTFGEGVASVQGSVTGSVDSVTQEVSATVTAIDGDNGAASVLSAWLSVGESDSAAAGSSSTITLGGTGSAANDIYNGRMIVIWSGAGVGQARIISDYVGSSKVATVSENWITAPDNTSSYVVIPLNLNSDPTGLTTLLTRIGTPSNLGSGATVAANLVDIEAQTDDIGAAGAGLNAIPWNSAWDTEVQSEVQDAIEVNHLDHLLAATYDPASKPGAADALLNELIESDAGVSRFTANSLENAPTGGSAPTAADIADAVWDETLADHLTAGSTGNALSAAGSAGDPWATALPGAYGSGTAGKIIGDNINATISSRASQASVDTIDDFLDTEIAAILADTNELQADWADGGRLDLILDSRASQSSLDTLDNLVDTEVAAILEDTGTTLPAQIAALSIPTAAQNADAVWDEARAGHTTNGTFGQFTPADVVSIDGSADFVEGLNLLSEAYQADGMVNANLYRIDGSASGIAQLQTFATAMITGTAQAGSTNSITLASGSSAVDHLYRSYIVVITGGTGAGQVRLIWAYNGTSKAASILPTWSINPASGSTYLLIPLGMTDANVGTFFYNDLVVEGLANLGNDYLNNGYSYADIVAIADDQTAADTLQAVLNGSGATLTADIAGSVSSVTGGINTGTGVITTLDALDAAQDTQHGTTQSAITGLNNLSAADVNTQVDIALTDYDAPTKAELDAAQTSIEADIAAAQGDITAILADTNELETDWSNGGRLDLILDELTAQGDTNEAAIAALNDLSSGDVTSAVTSALNSYDPPTKAELDTAQASIEADIATVQSDITAILTDTGTTIPAQIGSLNNLSAAQVNSEVDTALSDIHLDHLFATDYDPANKPGVSTALLNELVESDGGVSRYTANALENAPSGGSGGATAAQVWAYGNRTLTSAVTSVETTVSSTEVSMYRGDTFSASMTGLGALGTWTKVYLTVKRNDVRDTESLVQLLVTNPAAAGDGLQRLNGRTATAAWGSLTIDDDSAGDITIALSASATKALEPGDYLFDIKYINSTGSHIKASGTWIVNQDITRAIA